MYLGVDVGGTHTDAVLVGPDFTTLKTAKAVTKPETIESLRAVLSQLLADRDPKSLTRLTVSTTLGLNSVLTGSAPPVGILTTSGPGLDLNPADFGPLFRAVPGSQDHRGQVIAPLDLDKTKAAAKELAQKAKTIVVAAKFGPKNPELELAMAEVAQEALGPDGVVLAASRLFGRLNFARRLGGAILNGQVLKLYADFLGSLKNALKEFNLSCPVFVLKADGGVMSVDEALSRPVLALAAGPAASALGLWALASAAGDQKAEDVLMLDLGGTSLDLAVFSRGQPLLTPEGLTLAGRPTLVRGLLTHSLALGGDTDLEFINGEMVPLPRRQGPALALDPERVDLRPPTLTDALNVLGQCEVGDVSLSKKAFNRLAPGQAEPLAAKAVAAFLAKLKEAATTFIAAVNSQPAYTVSEFLIDYALKPTKAVVLGGPAATVAPLVAEALGAPATAPKEAATANALGAALARPTTEAELYADTATGTLSIPTLGIQKKIGARFDLEQAKATLLAALGPNSQIVAAEIFNQVSDYGDSGRVMRARAQTAPGLISQ
ncbi:MAG: hypothetical protein LBI10_04335 [Deltaproteobacteria bacterium]|jgi:N-methylhydantoinase A/oxoprolinase/acetone carboxylase beta subunit|nr:hypothetical protein [Deltaproteobacteria bacterium]